MKSSSYEAGRNLKVSLLGRKYWGVLSKQTRRVAVNVKEQRLEWLCLDRRLAEVTLRRLVPENALRR